MQLRLSLRLLADFRFFFLIFLHLPLLAQTTITGQVVDSLSGDGLEGASVMLKREGKTVTFVRTDKNGYFSLKVERERNDKLQGSLMDYSRQTIDLEKDDGNIIRMAQKSFRLKEVRVLASPVLQRKDTIIYDLTHYATDRDNTLKDVLKKLPGVEVAKNGRISYNGKELSRFTVEGMDLSKGQYNKLTDNIRARDVKRAEVVNHDQPIKALRNRVFTDDVGMNITLKDSVRDRLVPILRPYFLVGQPTHVGGDAAAMQIGKKKQLEYTVQYDRTGRDMEG
ncbi:carboxypeptidase-like regulatory domain-containing protein [Prevotellaceae bacterium LKV-178-WT-2A]|uniref:Carboxypeptidase-like regulatory domain-containing protein n=1 Tax=Hallella mizrahii TaxID=2606637 RepID=A0A7K0KE48_9BACT|nr:carboxypeptidase-like regulatory domain-containing protein [Hallella mizrahii]